MSSQFAVNKVSILHRSRALQRLGISEPTPVTFTRLKYSSQWRTYSGPSLVAPYMFIDQFRKHHWGLASHVLYQAPLSQEVNHINPFRPSLLDEAHDIVIM